MQRDLTAVALEYRARLGAGAKKAELPAPDKRVLISYTPAELHARARCARLNPGGRG